MNSPQTRVLDMLDTGRINVEEAVRLIEALAATMKIERKVKTDPSFFVPPTFPSEFSGLANNLY